MKILKYFYFFMVIIMLNTILVGQILASENVKFQHKEIRDLVKLVANAVRLIEVHGEKVFPDFRKKGSIWFNDKNYIFVDDMSGTEVVNPAFPQIEGKNIIDLQDKWGKYIVRDYLREVCTYGKNKKSGWFHYIWPNPMNGELSWKTTYVMKAISPVTKTEYVVGSGLYNVRMEKAFMIEAVEEASRLILTRGTTRAFEIIKSKGERFFYNDTYVFVSNKKGEELANPIFPEIRRNDVLTIQDMEKKFVFKELLEIAESKEGSGWFVSVWNSEDPENTVPNYKITYIKAITVNKELLIIGTSAPLEDF